tara:strand:- start:453 stop:629 length:177 start_codon:yes stop_codon:yes gene_type:complete
MEEVETWISVNIELYEFDLIIDTLENVSQKIDGEHFSIKPSGVDPRDISEEAMPIIST